MRCGLRRSFYFFTFQRRDALLEQLAVKLEADGGDVAALFRASRFPAPRNLEIAHGDLETAAERGVLLHGADALAHIDEQACVAWQQQIRVGPDACNGRRVRAAGKGRSSQNGRRGQ